MSKKYWRNQAATDALTLSGKMQFSCFPILSGNAEAQVTWAKRRLIAYFIGNISAKKYQNRSKLQQARMGRFLRHGVVWN